MKLFSALVLGMSFGLSAMAATIESDLQAVMLNNDFPQAVEIAKKAVAEQGPEFVATFGNTSKLSFDGGVSYYYLPVYAAPVPGSSTPKVFVGNIVSKMNDDERAVLPSVLGTYFSPAPTTP